MEFASTGGGDDRSRPTFLVPVRAHLLSQVRVMAGLQVLRHEFAVLGPGTAGHVQVGKVLAREWLWNIGLHRAVEVDRALGVVGGDVWVLGVCILITAGVIVVGQGDAGGVLTDVTGAMRRKLNGFIGIDVVGQGQRSDCGIVLNWSDMDIALWLDRCCSGN